MCASYQDGARCRQPVSTEGTCADGLSPIILPGAFDPLGDGDVANPYQVCAPCVDIGIRDANAQPLALCSEPAGCALEGEGARLDTTNARGISDASYARMPDGDRSIQIAVELSDEEGWLWSASGLPVSTELWADGNVPTSTPCVVLGTDGLLRGSDLCTGWFLCASTQVGSCVDADD